MEDGEVTETPVDDRHVAPDDVYQFYKFYLFEIIAEGILRPNGFEVDEETMQTEYPYVYDAFTNPSTHRGVLRPNVNAADRRQVLVIGKYDDTGYYSTMNQLYDLIGDADVIRTYGDTITEIIVKLYNRLNYLTFKYVEAENNRLIVVEEIPN